MTLNILTAICGAVLMSCRLSGGLAKLKDVRSWLISYSLPANIARRSMFGLLNWRILCDLSALKSVRSSCQASALATTATLADGEDQCNERQEEELIVERDYHEALNSFAKQVRNLAFAAAATRQPGAYAAQRLRQTLKSDSDEQNCDALESCSTSSYSEELQREAELARLRRLRSLLESSRRRLAEDEDAPTLQLRNRRQRIIKESGWSLVRLPG
uniref:Uncharacterized protein n=1 Tax=Macrostomum lignano TaxID=282301 RepID=A0A1I8FNI2_9PLAT